MKESDDALKSALLNGTDDKTLEEYEDHFVSMLDNFGVDQDLKEQLIANINKNAELGEEEAKANIKRAIIVLNMFNTGIITTSEDPNKPVDIQYVVNEFLRGGHLVVVDKGRLTNVLKDLSELGVTHRSHHSHYSNTRDPKSKGLSISAAPIFREILFGSAKYLDSNSGPKISWIQSEGAPWRPGERVQHGLNYVQYKATNSNVGQYGSSKHTDKKPILVFNRDDSHRRLFMTLYHDMIRGKHSSKGGAMHGGFFGKDVKHRDKLAKAVAGKVAAQFEGKEVIDQQIRKSTELLSKELKKYRTRSEFEEHFGFKKEGQKKGMEKKKQKDFAKNIIQEVRSKRSWREQVQNQKKDKGVAR